MTLSQTLIRARVCVRESGVPPAEPPARAAARTTSSTAPWSVSHVHGRLADGPWPPGRSGAWPGSSACPDSHACTCRSVGSVPAPLSKPRRRAPAPLWCRGGETRARAAAKSTSSAGYVARETKWAIAENGGQVKRSIPQSTSTCRPDPPTSGRSRMTSGGRSASRLVLAREYVEM